MSQYTQEGINKNTFRLLFESNTSATIDMQISKGLFEADYFTYYKHTLFNNIIHNLIINPRYFPNIHRKGNKSYSYSSNDEHFDFILLNKHLKEIFSKNPEYGKKLIRNHKNAYRASTCRFSIIIACHIDNSKLVIGNMPLKDGSNVLHRFVEIEYNDQIYVLDVAKNLIMKKDEYYKISQFEELGKINSSDLRALYNFCLETRLCDHTGIISMFGNEILNDLNKNQLIKKKNYQMPNFNSLIN